MNLTVQIVSDLHIECVDCQEGEDINPLDYFTPKADILIMAGDIGSFYNFKVLSRFIEQTCNLFHYVLYVAGNHEYVEKNNYKPLPMKLLTYRIINLSKRISNLFFLNRDSIRIDNICIAGCTLWSQLSSADKIERVVMPHSITKISGMTQEIYNKIHKNDLKFIKRMIKYCHENKLKLILVTHYCPSIFLLERYKQERPISVFYASHLEYLFVKTKIHTWIFGHTHYNHNTISRKGTHLISNQRGRNTKLSKGYSKSFVIKLKYLS